ncbi:trypsin-like peptidase domain-containing protein [Arthrobacter sp. YD4]|uniref:S1C family serine protease n=1 Tax=Arthrobacter sp. YD4 TaxID=3058043 RepID=UPI0025B4F6C0|nr:trypsin-like peptidase domain-containing protein [Arthrobacter sp. YD4]MDN3935625.1 trypsin-like peptidase domain-containing protein [Arthrobacter sp. YD4]
MFQDEADQAGNAPTITSGEPLPSPGYRTGRGRTFRAPVLIGAILAGGMLGGAAAAGAGSLLEPSTGAPASVSSPLTAQVVVNSTDGVAAVAVAAKKASPSVVTISATSDSAGGTGSGIILDQQGHILTNTHVVTLDGQSASASIEVRTNDGNVYPGTVVGTDPLSDLAVVKIDAQGLVPATLGDSSKANVGDNVIAIGAPLGLQGTVTDGIVSAVNRTITIASSAAPDTTGSTGNNGSGGSGRRYRYSQPGAQNSTGAASSDISINVLQTDAPINPGNSGGPLVNSAGEVLGINVAIASAGASTSGGQSGSIGVGFSIPVNDAKRVAQEIIAGGSASHGQLGASLSDAQAGPGSQFTSGARVTGVSGGTSAAKAGITSGDVITALDGRAIQNAEEATASFREHAAGDTMRITLIRGGKEQQVSVTLGSAPKA